MLARVPIQARTKPRVAETSQQRRNIRESIQESSNPPRLKLARRAHFALPAQHCVYLESGKAAERRSRVGKPRAPRYAVLGCESNLRRVRTGAARLDQLP